ncbi:Polycystic kidney disease and receptor for egg jelly-related protein [Anas platyrhynchos]|uniref:Polycystic kidney disease and receptor for egg jelly-related protein n=1 Tax=Anas platyrhynchos TaxID=8839 RepID=R0JBG6_ANAPL|nr:Polycystic kidney disease and receptor for egg jelly-related protein [Anas platyrhynchos]
MEQQFLLHQPFGCRGGDGNSSSWGMAAMSACGQLSCLPQHTRAKAAQDQAAVAQETQMAPASGSLASCAGKEGGHAGMLQTVLSPTSTPLPQRTSLVANIARDVCRFVSPRDWQREQCICKMTESCGSPSVHVASNKSTFDIRFLAAKAIVIPNTVDLEKALIADIPKNPVTLLTVLFILAAYLLLSLWAMQKDRADRASKDMIIVLPDNDPLDKESFLVTLYTGSRWGAGTKADVFLQLIGQNGTSDVHCLRHPQVSSFHQGSTDRFLLTTREELGDICTFRVWHSNRGPSPGWFLSRDKVENMSTQKTWIFMCRKWLSLNRGDGLLERTFSITKSKVPLPRKDYFLIHLSSHLRESHLWTSIFACFPTGTFTGLQRLSCWVAMLLLKLLFNIMFFKVANNEQYPIHLRLLENLLRQNRNHAKPLTAALAKYLVVLWIDTVVALNAADGLLPRGRVNETGEKQSRFVAFGNLVVGRACAEEEGDSRSCSCSLEQKVANGDGETEIFSHISDLIESLYLEHFGGIIHVNKPVTLHKNARLQLDNQTFLRK